MHLHIPLSELSLQCNFLQSLRDQLIPMIHSLLLCCGGHDKYRNELNSLASYVDSLRIILKLYELQILIVLFCLMMRYDLVSYFSIIL